MKIPDNVRINGIDYAIKWVKDLNDGAELCHGQFDSSSSTICINPKSQGSQQQCVTFLHELFHAILWSYQIDLATESKNVFVPKEEEKLVELLARGVYQVIKDNGAKMFSDIYEDTSANCNATESKGAET